MGSHIVWHAGSMGEIPITSCSCTGYTFYLNRGGQLGWLVRLVCSRGRLPKPATGQRPSCSVGLLTILHRQNYEVGHRMSPVLASFMRHRSMA